MYFSVFYSVLPLITSQWPAMSTVVEMAIDGLLSAVLLNFEYRETDVCNLIMKKISDETLTDLGECIAPNSDAIDTVGKDTLREILTAIHDHSGCPIDRFCVSGSIGHQLENSNDSLGFDVTVFVETELSHMSLEASTERVFRAVSNHIGNVLHIDHLGGHFEFHNYQINIGMAPSLGHKMHVQRKAIWDEIQRLSSSSQLSPSDLDRFSICLHESLASFMHLGDPHLHGLVRLARLWRERVILAAGCAELSTLAVVLVMIRCIEVERSRGLPLVSSPCGRKQPFPSERIFSEFLEYLSELPSLVMTWERFYEPHMVIDRNTHTIPYIIDPVNPWRNVLHTMTPGGIASVQNAARHALGLIKARVPIKALFSSPPPRKHKGG